LVVSKLLGNEILISGEIKQIELGWYYESKDYGLFWRCSGNTCRR
jgi:hypothetical protein